MKNKKIHLILGISLILIFIALILIYVYIFENKNKNNNILTGNTVNQNPEDLYSLFICSCCSKPVGECVCGMAKESRDFINKLSFQGMNKNEIINTYVRKYGIESVRNSELREKVQKNIIKNAPEDRPRISFDKQRYNFGDVSQRNGVVYVDFIIKNNGSKDLIINNMDSSCMCTTAKLIVDGRESPEFGMSMHGNPRGWYDTIPPGKTAILRVFYDPNKHKDLKGPVTRFITIFSNDPINFQTKIRIDLNQVP
jgi:hypothetical protein